MRSSIRRSLVLVPVAIALVSPAAAQAANVEPGVTPDPSTPSGKEYALPLVAGRQDASGTSNPKAGANTPFGVGITPPGGSGGSGSGSGSGSGGGHHGHGASGTSTAAGPTGATERRTDPNLRGRIGQAEEPGGTSLWTVGIALAVILAAGALALLLYRRPGQPA